jgi:hypothetical protein
VLTGEEAAMDSSVVRGGPEKVRLGAGELLPGLQLLILSMHPGQLALAMLCTGLFYSLS